MISPEIKMNLSAVWIDALGNALSRNHSHSNPLLVSISSFTNDGLPTEDSNIRQDVDALLTKQGKIAIEDSAFVIFPYPLWQVFDYPDIPEFTELCRKQLIGRLRKMHNKNKFGTYFERMIRYTGVKKTGGPSEVCDQLAFIHKIWHRARAKGKRPRQSALQISCFDPIKDHTGSALSGFPCLQQVSLAYGDDDNLVLNAYYPTQYVFDRGYGNYLGLCRLGLFLGKGLGVSLRQVNCFIGKPEVGKTQEGERAEIHKLWMKYKQ